MTILLPDFYRMSSVLKPLQKQVSLLPDVFIYHYTMCKTIMKYTSYFFIILFAGSSLFACNNQPTDQELQQTINNSFTKDLAGAALNATVDSGVATITGQCIGTGCTAEVVKRVKKINGVKDVQTHIIEQPK